MADARFWKKSYDPGLVDLDSREWETTYVQAIKEVFADYPDTCALAYMGTQISYAELDRYANRFAQMLHSQGFVKGDVVGINLPNIPEFVIAWLGTLRAGCVVSGVSPLLSAEEMEYQLRDSGARGLVTLDAIFAGRLLNFADRLSDLKLVVAAGVGGFLPPLKRLLGRLLRKLPTGKVSALTGKTIYRMDEIIYGERFPATALTVDLSPDDLAYLQYTGGTTGTPKGAMLSHRNAVADVVIWNKWMGLEEVRGRASALSGFPMFHAAGMFFNICCVFSGWTQVLVPNPRDTDHICAEFRKYRPILIANVPSLYQMLMDNPKFRSLNFSMLRACVSAAAPLPVDAQERLEGIIGRGKLLEIYGMTETAPLIAGNPFHGRKKMGTVGLPLLNTDIRLIVPGTGKIARPGEAGEICVKGPQVMVGYYNKPEETNQAFDKDGYLRTGDVAIQDTDGYLRIVDRTKDMIIVGGFKVFSARVEQVLCGHPAVEMCALIGIDNPGRPGSELVKAYITLSPAYQDSRNIDGLTEEILGYARERLSPFEVPRLIEFRPELPLTSVGKIDKKILRREARGKAWRGRERRAQTRALSELECEIDGLSDLQRTREKALIRNLSQQGLYVQADEPLDEGAEVGINIIQFGNTYWVEGKVLRRTKNGMAIKVAGTLPSEIITPEQE